MFIPVIETPTLFMRLAMTTIYISILITGSRFSYKNIMSCQLRIMVIN